MRKFDSKKILSVGIVSLLAASSLIPVGYAEVSTSPVNTPVFATVAERDAHRDQVMKAVEAGDYTAWYNLVKDTPRGALLITIITKDNFAKYVQMHNLQVQARTLRTELGLDKLKGDFKGKRGGRGDNGEHLGWGRGMMGQINK